MVLVSEEKGKMLLLGCLVLVGERFFFWGMFGVGD